MTEYWIRAQWPRQWLALNSYPKKYYTSLSPQRGCTHTRTHSHWIPEVNALIPKREGEVQPLAKDSSPPPPDRLNSQSQSFTPHDSHKLQANKTAHDRRPWSLARFLRVRKNITLNLQETVPREKLFAVEGTPAWHCGSDLSPRAGNPFGVRDAWLWEARLLSTGLVGGIVVPHLTEGETETWKRWVMKPRSSNHLGSILYPPQERTLRKPPQCCKIIFYPEKREIGFVSIMHITKSYTPVQLSWS